MVRLRRRRPGHRRSTTSTSPTTAAPTRSGSRTPRRRRRPTPARSATPTRSTASPPTTSASSSRRRQPPQATTTVIQHAHAPTDADTDAHARPRWSPWSRCRWKRSRSARARRRRKRRYWSSSSAERSTPRAADNASAYELAPVIKVKATGKGKNRKPATTKLGTPVPPASAVYNASNDQVTLTPRGKLTASKPEELIVNGPLVDRYAGPRDRRRRRRPWRAATTSRPSLAAEWRPAGCLGTNPTAAGERRGRGRSFARSRRARQTWHNEPPSPRGRFPGPPQVAVRPGAQPSIAVTCIVTLIAN